MDRYQVLKAQAFNSREIGSLGNASLMFIRQFQFPDTYDPLDGYVGVDHDHVMSEGRNRCIECLMRHTGFGELGLGDWARRTRDADEKFYVVSDVKIIAFLKDFLQAEPGTNWTGYRITQTVNRGNGAPVWTLEIFAKHPDSKTKVYTGQDAPNVERPRSRRMYQPSDQD
ncbi:hypothetical protein HZC53_03640 [Candidatus Uhrbacteria bacterium]|nr:hypothetical protein [Candidatus Uhrbacteria bacterium]